MSYHRTLVIFKEPSELCQNITSMLKKLVNQLLFMGRYLQSRPQIVCFVLQALFFSSPLVFTKTTLHSDKIVI